MASRLPSRLPNGNNSLAGEEIHLNDPIIGNVDDGELTQILTSQQGTGAQGPSPPPVALIETDYALESFQPSYEAQIEVARAAGTLITSNSRSSKRSKKPSKSKTPAPGANQGLAIAGLRPIPGASQIQTSVANQEVALARPSCSLDAEFDSPQPVDSTALERSSSKYPSNTLCILIVLTFGYRCLSPFGRSSRQGSYRLHRKSRRYNCWFPICSSCLTDSSSRRKPRTQDYWLWTR